MLYDKMCERAGQLNAIFQAYNVGVLTDDEVLEKAAKVLEEINRTIEGEIQQRLNPAAPKKKPAPALAPMTNLVN